MQIDPGEKNVLQEKGETPTVKDRIRKDVFYHEKNLKTGSFAFRRRIDTDCTDRLLAQRRQQFGADKKAVGATLKAAVEQSEDSYNLVENKALSVNARAILEAYLKEVEAGYTHVFEPQNVTHIWPTDVTVGDDKFGTAVFSMPENAVDPQAWKNAANALVANFLCYYQYNGNNVDFCVEIVKQEAADGQGEAADYMVIFAKRHYGEEGGEIWTPPAL